MPENRERPLPQPIPKITGTLELLKELPPKELTATDATQTMNLCPLATPRGIAFHTLLYKPNAPVRVIIKLG